MHKEFTNHKNNFSTHMGKINKNFKEQRAEIANLNSLLLHHAVESKAQNMYTNWGFQQGVPSLAPISTEDISTIIRDNFKANKGMFEGMTRPMPVGESSKGKGPVEKDDVRDPNANSDDE
ncbi:hypothetical protein PIB30_093674 [Stylosanthes scabra]|uniref:Uncharacterized protein n=1 Tax=Stylosanthes scabra TaxID=79078 RepID=A0ABU6QVV3_9FABA|nr:hypothetical protein [Stylosanthes scabra]